MSDMSVEPTGGSSHASNGCARSALLVSELAPVVRQVDGPAVASAGVGHFFWSVWPSSVENKLKTAIIGRGALAKSAELGPLRPHFVPRFGQPPGSSRPEVRADNEGIRRRRDSSDYSSDIS